MIFREFICGNEEVLKKLPKTKPTPTQMQIIEYILKHINEDIFQTDLEQILGLRRATVSGVLQTMEKNHLIERVTSKEDARKKRIVLNKDTEQLFLIKRKKLEELEKVVVRGISEETLQSFSRILDELIDNVKNKNQ